MQTEGSNLLESWVRRAEAAVGRGVNYFTPYRMMFFTFLLDLSTECDIVGAVKEIV